MNIAVGSIVNNIESAMAPTSVASLVTGWDANGPYSDVNDGDLSIQPDFANNQVLVHKPGIYKIEFDATIYADGYQPATFGIFSNGSLIADPAASRTVTFGYSENRNITIKAIYQSVFAFGSTTDSIQIYVTSADPNGNPQDIFLEQASLIVTRVG